MKKFPHRLKVNVFEFAVQLVAGFAAGVAGLVSMYLTDPLPRLVVLAVMAVTVVVVGHGLYRLLDRAVDGIRDRVHREPGCTCEYAAVDEPTGA